jgi:hypothetical protein
MGVRYPGRWGGRDMDWVATSMVMEMGGIGYTDVFPIERPRCGFATTRPTDEAFPSGGKDEG